MVRGGDIAMRNGGQSQKWDVTILSTDFIVSGRKMFLAGHPDQPSGGLPRPYHDWIHNGWIICSTFRKRFQSS
jgi:hypothetical protein